MSKIKGCSFSRKGRFPRKKGVALKFFSGSVPRPPIIIHYAIVMQKSGSAPEKLIKIDNTVGKISKKKYIK